MENLFTSKYSTDIVGINSGFDREIITGSLISLTYPKGLQRHLRASHILLKEFKAYAISLAKELKENSIKLSEEEKAYFKYLNNSKTDKEKLIKTILQERGQTPGIIAVLHSLETDYGFDIQGNQSTHKIELIGKKRKCLHIYFYFIDEIYGLCYFRVQTFFPFKIQIYLNGKEKLALDMSKDNIQYIKSDNCFNWIDDIKKAQELSDKINVSELHSTFDKWTEKYVPILKKLSENWPLKYQWSIKQVEYATDIIFNSEQRLDILFNQLLVYCNNTALPENVMSFLGKKMSGKQSGRIQSSCKRTYNGFRIKHQSGFLSIKMYNKAGNVLRIELTVNKVSELKVYRDVHHKNGTVTKELSQMEKSIYSLPYIIRFGKANTSRYLDFLSKMEDNSRGISELSDFTNRKTDNNRNYRGFNPLNENELLIFQALIHGALIANGFTSKNLKAYLSQIFKEQNWTTSKISRLLKRLIVFNLVKRLKKTYKYFLTEKGRIIITMFLKLRNMTIIPTLNTLLNELSPVLI